jgi:Zn-dependent protease with chaperone function
MSYLAGLRLKLRAAGSPTPLYVVAALLLVGMAWWLFVSRPGANQARNQSSAVRRVAQRIASPPTPKLEISDIRQTGQIVELKGTAECDAAVMINGERVPLIFDRCGFKHFVVLPEGPSTIAVTAQGPAGGVNTQMIKVNIE